MPLHIRELVIKTEIRSAPHQPISEESLDQLKKDVVQECMQRIKEANKKTIRR